MATALRRRKDESKIGKTISYPISVLINNVIVYALGLLYRTLKRNIIGYLYGTDREPVLEDKITESDDKC
jgi:hypothetical protein